MAAGDVAARVDRDLDPVAGASRDFRPFPRPLVAVECVQQSQLAIVFRSRQQIDALLCAAVQARPRRLVAADDGAEIGDLAVAARRREDDGDLDDVVAQHSTARQRENEKQQSAVPAGTDPGWYHTHHRVRPTASTAW